MEAWWISMEWFERMYWVIAIPFTLVFVIQLILTFAGADGIGEADFDGDLEGDLDDSGDIDDSGGAQFQILTIRNFITFLTVFAWTGIASINAGLSQGVTIVLSIALGLVSMLMVAGIMYMFMRAVESGTLDVKKAIGGVGEVYLPIKAKRGNIGKVQINIQGSLREMSAMTDDHDDLPTNTVVQVIQILNENILLVRKA